MTTSMFPRKALIQYEVGAKVVMTEECFEALHNRSRSILACPSTTYIESLRRFIGKVGEVTHVFPPAYSLTVAFETDDGDDALFHMDNFSVVPATKLRRLRIERDECPLRPDRVRSGSTVRMICTHRNYTLGDIQTSGIGHRMAGWASEALNYLHDHVLSDDKDRAKRQGVASSIRRLAGKVEREDSPTELSDICSTMLSQHFIWKPIYMYDHGEVTVSTKPFSDRWDSGMVGIIVFPKHTARHQWYTDRVNRLTVAEIDRFEAMLDSEVKTYDDYLNGRCYVAVLETRASEADEWEESDTCGGFYGDDHKASGLLDHFEYDPATTELIEP